MQIERSRPAGLHYDAGFVHPEERAALVRWLATIHPIWEDRFTDRRAAAADLLADGDESVARAMTISSVDAERFELGGGEGSHALNLGDWICHDM